MIIEHRCLHDSMSYLLQRALRTLEIRDPWLKRYMHGRFLSLLVHPVIYAAAGCSAPES
jgi:hypothetical protein